MTTIAVLLSSYNGEMFIEEQISSILDQSAVHVHLHIRDDGSTDNTKNILRNFKDNYKDLIFLYNLDEGQNIGIRNSFEFLMEQTRDKYDYFAFSDQDDFWEKTKLSALLEKIQTAEITNTDMPLMSFCDMSITNNQLETIQSHFYSSTYGFKKTIANAALIQGYVSGCLMLFNKQCLIEYFNHQRVYLHDYHAFQICRVKGKCIFHQEQLLKHRIHQNNEVGISPKTKVLIQFKNVFKFILNQKKYRDHILQDYYKLVEIIKEDAIQWKNFGFLNEAELDQLSFFQRKKWLCKHLLPFRKGPFDGLILIILF